MAWKRFALLIPLSLGAAPALDLSVTFDLSGLQTPHVSADRQGNILVAGYAKNCSMPVVKPISSCGALWIAKFDPTGQTLVFGTYLGTPDKPAAGLSAGVADIKADRDGNIVVLSTAFRSSLPTANAIQSKVVGLSNLYLCKFSADGSKLLYATYLGGTDVDSAAALVVDDTGAAYALASSSSTDFPTTPQSFSTQRLSSAGSSRNSRPTAGRSPLLRRSIGTVPTPACKWMRQDRQLSSRME